MRPYTCFPIFFFVEILKFSFFFIIVVVVGVISSLISLAFAYGKTEKFKMNKKNSKLLSEMGKQTLVNGNELQET